MRRKIDQDEGFTDGEVVDVWSKKRILIGLVVLTLFVSGAVFAFGKVKHKATQVLGIESGPRISSSYSQSVKLPTQKDATKLLDQARQELNNLTSENLSASQAGGLQKVIQDLQNIKSGSNSAVGVFCDLVCKK